jgi:AGZA family xanthine/uracil permease-like MFS transporter
LADIDLRDFGVAATALITALMMTLTSISDGLAIGFLVHLAVLALTGKVRTIKPMAWVLAALFLVHFLT